MGSSWFGDLWYGRLDFIANTQKERVNPRRSKKRNIESGRRNYVVCLRCKARGSWSIYLMLVNSSTATIPQRQHSRKVGSSSEALHL